MPPSPGTGGDGQPVLVLFGPTASGKTGLLERLFTGPRPLCAAEVISADSIQVYRGMDIGAAKPGAELRRRLPHHLIDIRDPNEQFNAGDFVRLASAACAEIGGRGALPVISGGTGFYLTNFMYGLSEAPPSDPALRAALKEELARKGPEALREELARRDPVSAERIHINDSYRLLRALEVCRAGGVPLSSFAWKKNLRPGYRFLLAGIRWDREELYRRIAARCEEMFRRGLPGEVRSLYERGYTPGDPGLRAIGYREFFVEDPGTGAGLGEGGTENAGAGRAGAAWFLSGDLEGVKALVIRNSRRYAKRQETFFAALPGVNWIPGGEGGVDGMSTGALDLLGSLVHTFLYPNP
jgi:tRNA dimethylallyltransferase